MIRNREPTPISIASHICLFQTRDEQPIEGIFVPGSEDAWLLAVLLLFACIAILLLNKARVFAERNAEKEEPYSSWTTSDRLTRRFISAIPSLTRELSLEIATTRQVETFERSHSRSILRSWIDLGTNRATIRVPVTYRFRVSLQQPWRMEPTGNTLIVYAPAIETCLPVAFDTAELEVRATRGWLRLPPHQLLAELHSELTPILAQHGQDRRRLEFVRSVCRESVAEFVSRWLESDELLRKQMFSAIEVRFPDEERLSAGSLQRLIR
jgi:hypothetical protein